MKPTAKKTDKPQCSVLVSSGVYSYQGHRCSRNATIERRGKLYCAQHDPDKNLAKREAKRRQWELEHAIRDAEGELEDVRARAADLVEDGAGVDALAEVRLRIAEARRVIAEADARLAEHHASLKVTA